MKTRQEFSSDSDYRDYLRTYFSFNTMISILGAVEYKGHMKIDEKQIADNSVAFADALIDALKNK